MKPTEIDSIKKLITLVSNQQHLINLSTELLELKNKMIELREMETLCLKRENKRLVRSLIISGFIFAFLAILNLTR